MDSPSPRPVRISCCANGRKRLSAIPGGGPPHSSSISMRTRSSVGDRMPARYRPSRPMKHARPARSQSAGGEKEGSRSRAPPRSRAARVEPRPSHAPARRSQLCSWRETRGARAPGIKPRGRDARALRLWRLSPGHRLWRRPASVENRRHVARRDRQSAQLVDDI